MIYIQLLPDRGGVAEGSRPGSRRTYRRMISGSSLRIQSIRVAAFMGAPSDEAHAGAWYISSASLSPETIEID